MYFPLIRAGHQWVNEDGHSLIRMVFAKGFWEFNGGNPLGWVWKSVEYPESFKPERG